MAQRAARHAIITGGSSGIGKAVAKQLARRGSNITIMARRPHVLAAAREEILAQRRSPDQTVATIAVDVSDRREVEAAAAEAGARQGPCGLLVTSAGMVHPGYFEKLPDDAFDRTMAVNYFGTLHMVRAVVPGMRQAGGGSIVLVSSGHGIIGMIGYASYSPTKFALRGLAESLRGELRSVGIRVSIAYPPDTDTPQLATERLTMPPEARAIAGMAKTWSADAVARSIVRGVDRGRLVITPGWEMSWLYRLHGLIQPLINWHFDRTGRKAVQEK